jgi:hypothetical protein
VIPVHITELPTALQAHPQSSHPRPKISQLPTKCEITHVLLGSRESERMFGPCL